MNLRSIVKNLDKTKKNIKYIIPVVCIAIILFSCDSPIEPKNGNNTPLDTTSHSFSWQTFEFGDDGAGSSRLRDVVIVNDSNIWAVGEIYLNDSTGQPDPIRYNVVVWDGSKWKVNRVPYYYQGQQFYNPIQSIFAFNSDDILFCGNGVIHWDGKNFNPVPIPSNIWGAFQMNKIWGKSKDDFYVVGNGGNIAHYQNEIWIRMESLTTLDILDIWGSKNIETNEEEIMAVASNPGSSYNRAILKIIGTTITKVTDQPIVHSLQGIWFVPNKHYYVVGDGIYEKRKFSDSNWKDSVKQITAYYTASVRGNAENDVFTVGAFGEFLHWNGVSWKSFREQTMLTNGSYKSVAVKQNIVVAVGGDLGNANLNSNALITIGLR